MIYDGPIKVLDYEDQLQINRNLREGMGNSIDEGKRSISFKIAKYLSISKIGDVIDGINIVLSFAMVAIHAIDVDSKLAPRNLELLRNFELGFVIYFLIDFLLNVYISDNKFMYLISLNSLIEYITIIPILLVHIGIVRRHPIIDFFRALRFLQVYKLDKLLARHTIESNRNIFRLIFTLMANLLISSAALYLFETALSGAVNLKNVITIDIQHNFYDWGYFMVVTLTVVGFGEVYPTGFFGQMIVIASLLVLLIKLPSDWSRYQKAKDLTSEYSSTRYNKEKEKMEHITVLGSYTMDTLKIFLQELYHQDHGFSKLTTILFSEKSPSPQLTSYLKQASFASKVIILEGNPLVFSNLFRASIESTKCSIILADKNTEDPAEEDQKIIMRYFALKNFLKKHSTRSVRVCIQLLQPESKRLFYSIHDPPYLDQVICIDELKMLLMSKNSICPGIITIISTLITSEKPVVYNSKEDGQEDSKWLKDYFGGLQNEIYRVPLLPKTFWGLSFSFISQQLYKNHRLTLFALEITKDGQTQVHLNPSDYVLNQRLTYGYVIATTLPNIQQFNDIEFPNVERDMSDNSTSQNTRDEIQYLLEQKFSAIKGNNKINPYSFYTSKINSLDAQTLHKKNDLKIEDHIVICGIINDMRLLILPLRNRNLKKIIPIIIIHNDIIPVKIWQDINMFPKIYVYVGSSTEHSDLNTCYISKASACIILNSSKESDRTSFMNDTDTINIYKSVKYLNPTIKIATEIASLGSLNFLGVNKTNVNQKYGFHSAEPFACGEIYMSSLLDTLICQAFYNPYVNSILMQFINGDSDLSEKEKRDLKKNKISRSTLFLIPVPPMFHNKEYGEVFDMMVLEHKIVPIGLMKAENSFDNKRPYVFLNPGPNTKVLQNDQIYVLSNKQPKNFDLVEQGDVKVDDRNEDRELKYWNLKTNMMGEEGKLDLEIAKELLLISHKTKKMTEKIGVYNKDNFTKGLVNPKFLSDIKRMFNRHFANQK